MLSIQSPVWVGHCLLGPAPSLGLSGPVTGRPLEGERGGGGEERGVLLNGRLMVHWLTLSEREREDETNDIYIT